MATSNLSGNAYVGTDANANDIGFYITPNKDCSIVAVVKSSLATATAVNIYDDAEAFVATASFSGDTATFSPPVNVSNGLNYYVTVAATTRAVETALAYPRARTDITYTSNAYMTGAGNPATLITGIGDDGNILDIQTFRGNRLTLLGVS